MVDKIIITETIHKDGDYPICFDCQEPAIGLQIQCNCGCKEIWCQPCFYRHYKDFANDISLLRFKKGNKGVSETLTNAIL